MTSSGRSKRWVQDVDQNIAWNTFFSFSELTLFEIIQDPPAAFLSHNKCMISNGSMIYQ